MTPIALAGIWSASRPAVVDRKWEPSPPAFTEHYFLVVSAEPGGAVTAFIRNPESNAGSAAGTRTVGISGSTVSLMRAGKPDIEGQLGAAGALDFSNVPGIGALRLHRAQPGDLRWFYPLDTDVWQYQAPAEIGDGWRVGTLSDVGMRVAPIAAIMNGIAALRSPALRSPYVQSVAIERHGTLVLDQYFYGFSADLPHDVRSAGKSVATLVVGRAIEDTHAFSPASRVLSVLDKYRPVANDDARKERMTVADLMTMSSGLACDDNDDASPGNEDAMQSQPDGTDWYRYTLGLPMEDAPGTRALYCSAGINLLGAVVRAKTGIALDRYFRDRFAVPMQFGEYELWLMPPPANEAYMAGGDRIRPRDFLKFGALVLDGGRWNGRQIVDAAWITQSTIPRSAPEGEGDRYGYGWHLGDVTVDGRSYGVINAGGNGGQLMIVVPALDLAMMVTAGNYNQYPVWRTFLAQFVTAAVRSCR